MAHLLLALIRTMDSEIAPSGLSKSSLGQAANGADAADAPEVGLSSHALSRAGADSWERWDGWVMLALFIVAGALRLYCLDCHSLWRDEIAVLESLRGGWSAVQASNVPLYSFVIWVSSRLVDPASTSVLVRLPSALAGALAPLVVYRLGQVLFSRPSALIAAVLVALGPQFLAYSQEMRSYAVLTLLSTLAVYSLVRALREPGPRWWLATGLTLVAAVLYSRTVVVVLLPALLPLFGLALVGLWRRGGQAKARVAGAASLLAALLFVGAGLAAWGMKLDINSYISPFTLPDMQRLNLVKLVKVAAGELAFFTPFGLGAQADARLQAGLFILGLLGVLWGLLRRRWLGVLVCALTVIIPLAVLAVGSINNPTYERFALFAGVFYFLLIGNGAGELARAISGIVFAKRAREGVLPRRISIATGVLLALPVVPFAVGAFLYHTPEGNATFAYRPDYRSASRYLTSHANGNDLIVFVGWDDRVSAYYWHDHPPVATYSAIDPRLWAHKGQGSVYWVVSYDTYYPALTVTRFPWADIASYERVLVLREPPGKPDLPSRLAGIAAKLLAAKPLDPVIEREVQIMQGDIAAAGDDAASAAAAYRAVHVDEPTIAFGNQWLATGLSYAQQGQTDQAWRAVLMAKFHEPAEPRVHRWITDHLDAPEVASERRRTLAVLAALSR